MNFSRMRPPERSGTIKLDTTGIPPLYFRFLTSKANASSRRVNPLTAVWALRALIEFTLSNARRFYSSMGNPLAGKGLSWSHAWALLWEFPKKSKTRRFPMNKWSEDWSEYLIVVTVYANIYFASCGEITFRRWLTLTPLSGNDFKKVTKKGV